MTDHKPGPGHNSDGEPVEGGQLRAFIERVERVNAEIADLTNDRKEILAEAKGAGFDTKIIRLLLAERKRDPSDRAEQETILELYRAAIASA